MENGQQKCCPPGADPGAGGWGPRPWELGLGVQAWGVRAGVPRWGWGSVRQIQGLGGWGSRRGGLGLGVQAWGGGVGAGVLRCGRSADPGAGGGAGGLGLGRSRSSGFLPLQGIQGSKTPPPLDKNCAARMQAQQILHSFMFFSLRLTFSPREREGPKSRMVGPSSQLLGPELLHFVGNNKGIFEV